MPKYELLIFDWDGTLVDSIGRIVTAIRVAAEQLGLPEREESAIKGIIGLAISDAIITLYPQLAGQAHVAEFQQRYAEYYLALEAEPSLAYPGVASTLQQLRDQGYQMAVATGKTRRGLDRVMQSHAWSELFEITRCADETASKPNPRMLHEILAHHNLKPEQALMVGDSVFDLQMAGNAGMDAVAVSYGAQDAKVLQQHGPCLTIDRFDQLATWLATGK